jgi:hypothetical protein
MQFTYAPAQSADLLQKFVCHNSIIALHCQLAGNGIWEKNDKLAMLMSTKPHTVHTHILTVEFHGLHLLWAIHKKITYGL